MLCFPNAKINLGLNIINKRPDGFHNLETIFCPASLCDILEFVPETGLKQGECVLDVTGINIDGAPELNLAVKAYRSLSNDFMLPGVHIHLHKLIPPGAGLGGGSSDAAFMLKFLDKEFDLKLDENALSAYASGLGSDCAFFLRNRPVFAYERGNQFREVSGIPENLQLAVVNPGIHISTADAYREVMPRKPLQSLEELIKLPVAAWKDKIINDFEPAMVSRFPVIGDIRTKLYNAGAAYASMSGSGSSVFALFQDKVPAIRELFPDFFTWSGPMTEVTV